MNTKKQYTSPTLVVVDVELQLMKQLSGIDTMTDSKKLEWNDNADAQSAADGW